MLIVKYTRSTTIYLKMKFGKRLLKEVDEVQRAEAGDRTGSPSASSSASGVNAIGTGSGLVKSRFYVDYRELKKKIKMIALEYVSEATS